MPKFEQVYTGEFIKWTGDNLLEVQQFLGMFVFVAPAIGTKDVLFLANGNDTPDGSNIKPESRAAVVIAPAYIGRNQGATPGRYNFHLYGDYGAADIFERSWRPAEEPARTPILVYRRRDYPEHINTIEWRGDNKDDVEAFLFERFGDEVAITKADDGLFLDRCFDEEGAGQHYVAKGWHIAECDGVLTVFDPEQIKRLELLEGFAS